MNCKGYKLYNVLLPIWLMLAFPVTWLVVLPANFIIDSAVLLLALRAAGETGLKEKWKSSILRIWIFGFISDFAGVALLLICQFIYGEGAFYDWFYDSITVPVMTNPFTGVFGFLFVLAAVALSGFCIYLLDKKWAFSKTDASPELKTKLALWLAVLTAPWTFFLPSEWFWF